MARQGRGLGGQLGLHVGPGVRLEGA
jgi:hypothetical protein